MLAGRANGVLPLMCTVNCDLSPCQCAHTSFDDQPCTPSDCSWALAYTWSKGQLPPAKAAIVLAYAGEPLYREDAQGEVDGAEDIEAAVGHFQDASGLEAFPDAADARRQAMTEELLGDLSLDGHEPSSNSLQ